MAVTHASSCCTNWRGVDQLAARARLLIKKNGLAGAAI
jgi:hypothetical protein